MGMSTHIIGLRTTNDKTYQKHAKVLRACIDAGVSELPKETAEYFGEKYPEEYLFEEVLAVKVPAEEWGEDMQEGFEIKVAYIPQGVETIRFYNSY